MSENAVPITPGTGGASIAADSAGGNLYQQVKVVDATLGSTNAWKVNTDGSAQVSVAGVVSVNIVSGGTTGSVSGTVGASIIGTVPVVQSGTVISSISGGISINSSVATVIIGGSIAASFTPPANQSVSGTVGSSIIGQLPGGNAILGAVAASISGTVNVSGSVFAVVQSLQGASVSGTTGSSIIGIVPALPAIYASSTQGITSVMTGVSSVLVLGAPSGTQKNYITHILVTNAAAVGTTVTIQDGASIIWGGYAAASGGGWSENFNPPLAQPTSVKALYATSSVQASVYVAINGFTGN